MNSIIYDDEIITPEGDKWKYYNNFTKKLDKKDCIKFSLFCAKIVNPNTKESNLCIELVEKWLIDEKLVNIEELWDAASAASAAATAYSASATNAAYIAANTADAAWYATFDATYSIYAATNAATYSVDVAADKINKYLQILLRKTKQFQNNKILEQISKNDVDKLELVDWNMITDIMLEEYNIVHEFEYEDIFGRRCLIELLRKEYA